MVAAVAVAAVDCGWWGVCQGPRDGGGGELGQTGPAGAAVMLYVGEATELWAARVLDWAERDLQGWQQRQ
jgi:hypothetical protein